MHQVWSNTSSFIKEQEINWIINDFALIWNASGIWSDVSGSIEIISPDFNFGNKKYQLRISERTGRSITVDGVSLDPADKLVFFVNLCKPKEVGSLSIDVEGQKIAGIFGDPSGKTIAASVGFKNQISEVEVDGDFRDIYFCINLHETHMEIKVKLYGPGSIINTISQEPVMDAGPTKLLADVWAMLNRSTENADFSIECGGKIFTCHEFILRARSTVLNVILTVVDVGPNTIAVFLEYMYIGEITVEVDNMKELIYIADKYELKGLMEICFRRLPEVEDHMVVDFLFMADKYNFVKFKKEAMRRINMNKSKYMKDEKFIEKLQEVSAFC